MEKAVELPDTLSDLILLALDDLERAEASRQHKVDMYAWHQPDAIKVRGSKCVVCFAGSVMAFTLGAEASKRLGPSNWDAVTERKLRALDQVRLGRIAIAIEVFHGRQDGFVFDGTVDVALVRYEKNPAKFKAGIRLVVDALKVVGQ